LGKIGDRILVFASRSQDDAAIEIGGEVIGIEFDRAGVILDRPLQISEIRSIDGAVVVRIRIARIEAQRLCKVFDRRFGFAQCRSNVASVDISGGSRAEIDRTYAMTLYIAHQESGDRRQFGLEKSRFYRQVSPEKAK
jgi:hypothetical protein